MKTTLAVHIFLALSLYSSLGCEKKAENQVQNGTPEPGLSSSVEIPVSVSETQTKLTGLNIENYEIAIEECKSGFASSTEGSTLKVIVGDQGCRAVLRSMTIDGHIFKPMANLPSNTIYVSSQFPDRRIAVNASSQLSKPQVRADDKIIFELSELVAKAGRSVGVGSQIQKTVSGDKAPDYEMFDAVFTGLDNKGSPIINFSLVCTATSSIGDNYCGDNKVYGGVEEGGLLLSMYEGERPSSPEELDSLSWQTPSGGWGVGEDNVIRIHAINFIGHGQRFYNATERYTVTLIVRTPSGSQASFTATFDPLESNSNAVVTFEDIVIGTGPEVADGKKVTINWLEKWLDESGQEWVTGQSSIYPWTFAPAVGMPGIYEGMQGMKKGGNRRILIPGSISRSGFDEQVFLKLLDVQ